MNEDESGLPATDGADIATSTAATPEGNRSEIAGQIRSALEGEQPVDTNSKRDQLRREIDATLTKVTAEAEKPKPEASDGRARGPDGKFIAKDAAGNDIPEPAIEPVATEPAVIADAAPGSWKKDSQAKWAEVPDWARAEITKRESDIANLSTKYQGLKSVEPILDWAAPIAQRLGVGNVPALVHQWAQAQEALMNPQTAPQAIAFLAKQYNVQLPQAQLQAPAEQQQADPNVWVDPEIAALKQQLQSYDQRWAALDQQAEQAARDYQYSTLNEKKSAIGKFGDEKDASGQLLRPHLDTVMRDMVAGIARIRSTNPQLSDQDVLQQAYDMAVWGNPDTRKLVMDAQRVAEEKENIAKARARAQAATRQAVSPASASPQGSPAPQPVKGTVRDEIRANFERMTA